MGTVDTTGTPTADAKARVSARDAMDVLERLLSGTTYGSIKASKTIAFVLDGATFVLEPKQARVTETVSAAADRSALVVRTQPAVLVRLLTEPDMWIGDDESLALEGDPQALKPLIDALHGGKSPIATRLDMFKKK